MTRMMVAGMQPNYPAKVSAASLHQLPPSVRQSTTTYVCVASYYILHCTSIILIPRHIPKHPVTVAMSTTIEAETLKQHLADNPPAIVPLAIKPHFEALSDKEKLYSHHLSM